MAIKLSISGCQGKMGSRILDLALKDSKFEVVCVLERKDYPNLNTKINNLTISDDISEIKNADVLIEFTTPEATIEHLKSCLNFKQAMVIGTTGLADEQKREVETAAKKIPIVFSPNMSVGVNLLFKLVKEATTKLAKNYSVKIIETHHIYKKDAPSGTARQLAKIIEEATKRQVSDIKSIREGEIVGDHEVIFESGVDRIKLSHSAKTRDIFAEGALVAAKWIIKKKSGLYSMQDVLG